MATNASLGIEAGGPGVDAVLADGGVVHVRPIRPSDGEALADFHENLSFESRYFRFFSPHPVLRPAEVTRFTTVDGVDRVALVATEAGRLVAVGRYDRLDDAEEAEVAFVVADAHQGRGLGSLLLEHLAAVAAVNGVTRFVAETLASNQRMLRVFRDTGFPVVTSLDDGVVHVTFPIDPTERSREVSESREHRAESRSVARVLTPTSIAVIGASRDRGSVGQAVFRNLLRGGFAGPVYPVNPGAGHVSSVRAFDSVLDVPGQVDLAIIGVPTAAVAGVVEECAQKGVTGLVVLSSGFSETGEAGGEEQERVLRLARSHGMRLVGPNGIGIVNTDPSVSMNATFAPYEPVAGVAGLLSQSAALGIAMLAAAAESGLGVSSFVSVGNKADVSGNDLLQFWEDDPRTDVILLYLESFGNPRKFGRLARRVGRKKPIVVVKGGRTASGARTTEAAVDALFHQAGVIRVDTVQQMLDVGRMLAHQPVPQGPRLAIVTNASGPARMAEDACAAAGLDLAEPFVDLSFDATPDDYAIAISGVLRRRVADALLVVFAPTRAARAESVAAAVASAVTPYDAAVAAAFLATREEPASLRFGDTRRIPFFRAPEEAVRAIGLAAAYGAWRGRTPGDVPSLDVDVAAARRVVDRVVGTGAVELDDGDAVMLLGTFGITCGNVPDTVADADHGVEVAVGVVQDPGFGPLVTVGMGGPASDLIGDRAYRAVPLTDVDARDLWRSLRTAPLFTGYRGSAPVDTRALEDLLLRLGLLADAVPELAEVALDHVVVHEQGVAVGRPRVRVAPPRPPTDVIRRLR